MDKKQIMIIFIAIIMLGSIIGFTFYSTTQRNSEQQSKQAQPTEEPILSYMAENIDGNIEKLLASGLVFGCTSSVGLQEINDNVLQLKGIKSILGSEFLKNPELCPDLLYKANVLFDSNVNFSILINELEEKASFVKPGIYRKAVVKIPQKVRLKGTGIAADLNITKDFNFPQPFVEALTDAQAMEKDNVKLSVELQLKGNEIVFVNAFITENLSLYSFHEIQLTSKLFSLDNTIVFSEVDTEYTGFKASELEEKIKTLPEASDAKIEVSNIGRLSVFFDYHDTNADALKESIHAKLSSFEEIQSMEFFKLEDLNKGKIVIDWNSFFDLLSLKEKIRNALLEVQLSENDIEIKNPTATIQGEITLNSNETQNLENKIKQLLFPDILPKLHQTAKIAFTSFEDNNKSFIATQPIPAVVFLGHTMSDDINFIVRFYAQRQLVVSAQAVEQGIR